MWIWDWLHDTFEAIFKNKPYRTGIMNSTDFTSVSLIYLQKKYILK